MNSQHHQEDTHKDTLKVNININEDYDMKNIFINLKSDRLQKFSKEEAEDIINNNGIAFLTNGQWIGSKKSFVSIFTQDSGSINQLKEIFNKYGNLSYHSYEKNNGFILFAINRQLLKGYYHQISQFMDKNHEIEYPDIYVTVSNSFEKTDISNIPPDLDDIYILINNKELELTVSDETNQTKNKNDLELILPIDLSRIIKKLEYQEVLDSEEEKSKLQLQKILVSLIEKKKDEASVSIHLKLSEKKYEPIELSDLIQLLHC